MANISYIVIYATLFCTLLVRRSANRLFADFYAQTCPNASMIVQRAIMEALTTDPRITASLLRLHVHDCFVKGCDGSILLDTTDTMQSEKASIINVNSLRGFEVVDYIKIALENACPGVVSCADILAIASEISVVMAGGPSWIVPLGRRDGLIAIRTLADTQLPEVIDSLDRLKERFANVNLDTTDFVALSGGHTFGKVRCDNVVFRMFDFGVIPVVPDPTLTPSRGEILGKICPHYGDYDVTTDLDPLTPNTFDNKFFEAIKEHKGVLTSDQILTTGEDTLAIVNKFVANQTAFFESFTTAMIKMGNISVLTGAQGEIRQNCRRVNGDQMIRQLSNGRYFADS